MKESIENKVRYTAWIDKDILAKFSEIAKKKGLSISSYLRMYIVAEIRKDELEEGK